MRRKSVESVANWVCNKPAAPCTRCDEMLCVPCAQLPWSALCNTTPAPCLQPFTMDAHRKLFWQEEGFELQHFHSSGQYVAAGFVEKNRDTLPEEVGQLMRAAGFGPAGLKRAGFDAAAARAAGFGAGELKLGGFSLGELREAGFIAREMKDERFSLAELKQGAYSAEEAVKQLSL